MSGIFSQNVPGMLYEVAYICKQYWWILNFADILNDPYIFDYSSGIIVDRLVFIAQPSDQQEFYNQDEESHGTEICLLQVGL